MCCYIYTLKKTELTKRGVHAFGTNINDRLILLRIMKVVWEREQNSSALQRFDELYSEIHRERREKKVRYGEARIKRAVRQRSYPEENITVSCSSGQNLKTVRKNQ